MPGLRIQHPNLELCHLYAPGRLVPLDPKAKGPFDFCRIATLSTRERLEILEQDIRAYFGIPKGTPIMRIGFLDDVLAQHQARQSLDEWRWRLFIGLSHQSLFQGADVAVVHHESEFVQRAKSLQMLAWRKAGEKGFAYTAEYVDVPSGDQLIKVRLAGFPGISDPKHPSCALLDYAWTQLRLHEYGDPITVLPQSYRKQQLQVAALAALFDMPMPERERVVSIFLDTHQRITGHLRFSELKCVEL